MSASRFYYKPLDTVVVVTIRTNAVRYVARWKGDALHLTVPAGERYENVIQALEDMTPRLLQSKPGETDALIHIGMRLQIDGDRTLSIESSGRPGRYMRSKMVDRDNLVITVDSDVDLQSPGAQRDLSRFILKVLGIWVYDLGVLTGKAIATRLGLQVDEWLPGKGAKLLGRCKVERSRHTGRRHSTITLSSAITLLPAELREYVVCHELAHLTYMDHSPAFHALVDSYTDGREAELEAKLKRFRWPIIRT